MPPRFAGAVSPRGPARPGAASVSGGSSGGGNSLVLLFGLAVLGGITLLFSSRYIDVLTGDGTWEDSAALNAHGHEEAQVEAVLRQLEEARLHQHQNQHQHVGSSSQIRQIHSWGKHEVVTTVRSGSSPVSADSSPWRDGSESDGTSDKLAQTDDVDMAMLAVEARTDDPEEQSIAAFVDKETREELSRLREREQQRLQQQNQPRPMQHVGPSPDEPLELEAADAAPPKKKKAKFPRLSVKDLKERGLDDKLYVYRVTGRDGVAVRTKPTPIGGIRGVTTGKIVRFHKPTELIVGMQIGHAYGLWLKICDYQWAPISKKDQAGKFHPVMKLVKTISIPARLKHYWAEPIKDCSSEEYATAKARQLCEDANNVRNGVLRIMRKFKVISRDIDPDAELRAATSKKPSDGNDDSDSDGDGDGYGDSDSDNARDDSKDYSGDDSASTGLQHLDDVAYGEDDSALSDGEQTDGDSTSSDADEEGDRAEGNEDEAEADDDEGASPAYGGDPALLGDSADGDDGADSETGAGAHSDLDGSSAEPEEEEKRDPITVMRENCASIKSWAVCTRYSECAWRKLPGEAYCELDEDEPIDTASLGKLFYDPDLNWHKPTAPGADKVKYFVYQPSGGINNQRKQLENAMIICRLTNRTCIAPPIAPHSNYFYNYNRVPAKGVVSSQRLFNLRELSVAGPVQSVPEGMTFLDFVEEMEKHYTVQTVARDVRRFKPGTLLKWDERSIKRLYSRTKAQVLYFANQTMWGTLEWKGKLAGFNDRAFVNMHSTYCDHAKETARKIAEYLGDYNALHVSFGFPCSPFLSFHLLGSALLTSSAFLFAVPHRHTPTPRTNRRITDPARRQGRRGQLWQG